MTEEQKNNMKEYIAVLRSGIYQQGCNNPKGSVLRISNNEYSPEGILCMLFGGGEWQRLPKQWFYVTPTGDAFQFIAPMRAKKAIGLYDISDIALHEMHRNGMTFDQIADYLESQLNEVSNEK